MADLEVGDGKVFASVAAAQVVHVTGDITVVFPRVLGDRIYKEKVTVTKDITVRSSAPGEPMVMSNWIIQSDCVLEDIQWKVEGANARMLDSDGTARTIVIRRCILEVTSNLLESAEFNGGDQVTMENCIIFGGSKGVRIRGNGNINARHCVFVHMTTAFFIDGGSTSSAINCVFWDVANFSIGTLLTGNNNATDKSSGLPGSNNQFDLVKADTGFNYFFSPPAGSFFPWDWRQQQSVLAGGKLDGTAQQGVLSEDIDGNARDGVNDNIGVSQGHPGLGAPVVIPATPALA